jgi:hypothetical protein
MTAISTDDRFIDRHEIPDLLALASLGSMLVQKDGMRSTKPPYNLPILFYPRLLPPYD